MKGSPNPLLEAALEALARGWSILPVHAGSVRDKDPHSAALIRTGYFRFEPSLGRNRATWKPLQVAPPTPEQVEQWFAHPHEMGMALITGPLSRRFVIDFDGPAGKALAWDYGIQAHVRTGGGLHLHVRYPEFRVANSVGKQTPSMPDAVDIRGDGGNAILPPTATRKGQYDYLRDPDDPASLTELPGELRDLLRLHPPVQQVVKHHQGPLPSGADRYPAELILQWALRRVQSGGGRNEVGNNLAWVLYNNGYNDHEVAIIGQRYVTEVEHLKSPPYTWSEWTTSQRSAANAERGAPWSSKDQAGRAGPGRPASAEQALEGVYQQLSAEDQELGAYLLSCAWASKGRGVEETLSYLKLIGHPAPQATVRKAFKAAQTPSQTLEEFLNGRRVRWGS